MAEGSGGSGEADFNNAYWSSTTNATTFFTTDSSTWTVTLDSTNATTTSGWPVHWTIVPPPGGPVRPLPPIPEPMPVLAIRNAHGREWAEAWRENARNGRIVSGQPDGDAVLMEFRPPGMDHRLRILRVRCPSTGHYAYLRTPPGISDAQEARRWTFGEQPLELVQET